MKLNSIVDRSRVRINNRDPLPLYAWAMSNGTASFLSLVKKSYIKAYSKQAVKTCLITSPREETYERG